MPKHLLACLAMCLAMLVALIGPLAAETESQSPAQKTDLTATIAPLYAKPGEQMTVTAIQPCPQPMQVFWDLGPGALSGNVQTGSDGKWVVHFAAPLTVGVVPFFARCAFGITAAPVALYQQLNFTVVAPRPRPPAG